MLRAASKWRLPIIALCLLTITSLLSLGIFTKGRTASAAAPISISTIQGTFYPNPNDSGAFDPSVLSTPVFSQQFPVIDFNPPSYNTPQKLSQWDKWSKLE
jgi:hypothetical protein